MFLAALDQTVVSTSIRTIADDLQGLQLQAWATTTYLITSTVSTPLYGKLSDIYGRKKFFVTAIIIFIIGSLLCTLATSMLQLAAFRAVQGIGAGGLFSLALAIVGDIVPPLQRAKYQGYFLAVFGTSSVLGPLIGGFFAGHEQFLSIAGWRWVFLVNVPIGIIALVVVLAKLNVSSPRQNHRIDWWGAITLMLGVVPLLVVAEQGREWGWTSPLAISFLVAGVLGVVLFIFAEKRAGEEALLPGSIFTNRALVVTVATSVAVGISMFGGLIMLPLYMQVVRGASPMQSGFMMLPLMLGMMVTSAVIGRVTSATGRIREFPIIGTFIVAVGMFGLSYETADSSMWFIAGFMVVVGIGLGHCMQPLMLIAQNSVGPEKIGMATSATTFFRQMGGTLGVALFLSMLFASVKDHIATAVTAAARTDGFKSAVAQALQQPSTDVQAHHILTALSTGNPQGLESVTKDSSVIERLPTAVAMPFKEGFATAMVDVFITAGFVAVIGCAISFALPAINLRSTSALAARATTD